MTQFFRNTIALVTELNNYHLELIRLKELHEQKKIKMQGLGLGALEQKALLEFGSSTQKAHEMCLRASIANLTEKYKQSVVLLRPGREPSESLQLAKQQYSAAAAAATQILRAGYKHQRPHAEVFNDARDVFLETFLVNLNEVLDINTDALYSEFEVAPEPEICDLLDQASSKKPVVQTKQSPISTSEAVFTPEIEEPTQMFVPIAGPK